MTPPFNVSSSIKYFLNMHELLSHRISELVDKIVKIRNSIAHGTQVYREDLIWPIPQFFPLNIESFDYLDIIKLLVKKSISCFLGVELWKEEWEEFKSNLPPTLGEIKEFIESEKYKEVENNDFIKGEYQGITPFSITIEYISNNIIFQRLENSLRSIFLTESISHKFKDELYLPAIILADSEDKILAEKCRNFIISSRDDLDLKGAYRNLQYRSVNKLDWIKKFLSDKII